MNYRSIIYSAFLRAADSVSKRICCHPPGKDLLSSVKIVSHRGEHDNIKVLENSLAAFDLAIKKGAWGIEFDIRWTKDNVPVVFHDNNLGRIFKTDRKIDSFFFSELKRRFPVIPSLKDVIDRYSGKCHLMVEIKFEKYYSIEKKSSILYRILDPLVPEKDFHLLSLNFSIFDRITSFPPATFLPVAEFNLLKASRIALKKGYGGLLGHYYLLNSRIIRKHIKAGQKIGTGYISSKFALFREVSRNVTWIFTHDTEKLKSIIDGS